MIKHIWFDMSGTLTELDPVAHDKLRYGIYAKLTGKTLDKNLIVEYQELLERHGSNAAIFKSLGQGADFWGKTIESADIPNLPLTPNLYFVKDPTVPEVLDQLKNVIPISLFTNIKTSKVLKSVGINPSWFTYIIQAGDVAEPKPAPEGFKKIIELTKLPVAEVLYVGDDVVKDIRPAKLEGLKTGLMWKQSREADYNFSSMTDILSLFSRVNL